MDNAEQLNGMTMQMLLKCSIRQIDGVKLKSIWRSVKKEERQWKKPTKVVVYVVDGIIQCVLTTNNVDVYVSNMTFGMIKPPWDKHGLYGLPVM
jgi:hypothetical protein